MNSIEKVLQNKLIFEDLKDLSNGAEPIENKLQLIEFSAWWAAFNHSGVFSDLEIEKSLSSISEELKITESALYTPNSFLHVMTESYYTGGHTRIVEKWVNSSDQEEKHSLLLLNQHTHIPAWLINAIEKKNGEIYNLTSIQTYVLKALHLREIASSYEYIVLHVHVYDITPILAFGTKKFKRPIIYVNHADHSFWLGISIIDILTEGSTDAISFTRSKRGIVNQSILPVPLERNSIQKTQKNTTLKKLGYPTDQNIKYILSMASPQKYRLYNTIAFIEMALLIIQENQNARIIVIGPDKYKEKEWLMAYNKSNGNIDAVGFKNRNEVELYKHICDIYIDSFPFNSYTSFLEFAVLGIPSFALKTVFNDLDILKNTPNHFHNIEDMIKEIGMLISGKTDKEKYNLQNKTLEIHDLNTSWIDYKKLLILNTPKKHSLSWSLNNKNTIDKYDETLFSMNNANQRSIFISKHISFTYNYKILCIYLKNNYISKVSFIWQIIQIVRYQLKKILFFANVKRKIANLIKRK